MELYFAPFSASLVVRIVAAEAGIELTFRQVEIYEKVFTDTRRDYLEPVPLGLVPVLRMDDGRTLTEISAIALYLSDQNPTAALAPRFGTPEYYELLQWLSFMATEFHKKILWVLFRREAPREAKQFALRGVSAVLDHLERRLEGRSFLVAETFTAADAYAAWALTLSRVRNIDFGDRPALRGYVDRVLSRPSVRDAIALETPLAEAAMQRQKPVRSAGAPYVEPPSEGTKPIH